MADNLRVPSSLRQYLDVHDSPLSPYNTPQGKSYVYGTLPLFATKLFASGVGRDDYGRLNILGRRLSALIDTLSILLVFVLALILFEREDKRVAAWGALLAAALYAVTVAAIQQAHFFVTDTWLVLFVLLSFTLAAVLVRATTARPPPRLPLLVFALGGVLGLAIGCKISGVIAAIPIGIALLAQAVAFARTAPPVAAAVRLCAAGLATAVSAYVAFRWVDPYAFASSNWLDLSTNRHFRSALLHEQDAVAGKFLIPPSYQWLLSPRFWAPAENLGFWQLGPALGVAALIGVAVLGWRAVRGVRHFSDTTAATIALMLVALAAASFFYFSTRFVHAGRYLLPILPLLCIAGATAILALGRFSSVLRVAAAAVVLVPTLLYALAYHHIYTEPNTRVAASDWLVAHVPMGATIANEHWDDPLPTGGAAASFQGVIVPVFDPDDEDKLAKLHAGLAQADYYVLSSPRAWKTVGRLPRRFPLTTRYYQLLFAGRLGFRRIASFHSYPELLGIEIPDGRAEEAWWIYDHPPVQIFRKTSRLSLKEFRRRICGYPAAARCAVART